MIKVLKNRVLIECDESERTSESGLIIYPDQSISRSTKGIVKNVGNGKLNKDGSRQNMAVNIGDRVIFDKFSGTEIFIDGKRHLSIYEDEIFGVIED